MDPQQDAQVVQLVKQHRAALEEALEAALEAALEPTGSLVPGLRPEQRAPTRTAPVVRLAASLGRERVGG